MSNTSTKRTASNSELLKVFEIAEVSPSVIIERNDFADPETKRLYEKWSIAWEAESDIRAETIAYLKWSISNKG